MFLNEIAARLYITAQDTSARWPPQTPSHLQQEDVSQSCSQAYVASACLGKAIEIRAASKTNAVDTHKQASNP